MNTPKSKERFLKYGAIVLIVVLALVGVATVKGLFQKSRENQSTSTVQVYGGQGDPLIIMGSGTVTLNGEQPEPASCASSVYYTSYPAKCVDAEGNLIQAKEGTWFEGSIP